MIIVNIQSEMVEIAATFNENVNNDSEGLKYILIKGEEWVELDKITTKELQRTLKVAKKRFLPKTLMEDWEQQIIIKKTLINLETNVKM